mmetsp:Transcript_69266/g.150761  ORF Transcript_69266/g.150761 Transcript_69266/m.150761 type:complete len:564 (+) Transcript_69266:124-1815(+)
MALDGEKEELSYWQRCRGLFGRDGWRPLGRSSLEKMPAPPTDMFKDINNLARGGSTVDGIVFNSRYHNGLAGRIVKDKRFEFTTIGVICVNACLIGYDSDYSARWGKPDNLYDGPWGFIVAEYIFATYFSMEILVRFLAYRWDFKRRLQFLCDGWFVFDGLLVAFMVAETWILPFLGDGSPLGQLSILRLLRILRITRIAKLMKAFPELMMIVKGITAATKAVFWTAILLVIITYTWAILFTNEYHQGNFEDDEVEEGSAEELFGSMGKSMLTLLVMGTILDDVTACTDTIRASGNYMMLLCFIVYILLNSFTMMNMLVGILVEVVGSTAEGEKNRMLEENVRESIRTIFGKMDQDGSGVISRNEFLKNARHRTVMKALEELNIKDKEFETYVEIMFEEGKDDEGIAFDKLLNTILRLRPGTAVSALDFAAFKQLVTNSHGVMKERVVKVEMLLRLLADCRAGQQKQGDVGPHETRNQDQMPIKPVVGAPPEGVATACSKKVTLGMLADLSRTCTADIVAELQGRLGMANLDDIGDHHALVSEERRGQGRVADTFHTLGVPTQ